MGSLEEDVELAPMGLDVATGSEESVTFIDNTEKKPSVFVNEKYPSKSQSSSVSSDSSSKILLFRSSLLGMFTNNWHLVKVVIMVAIFIATTIYLGFAFAMEPNAAMYIAILVYPIVIYKLICNIEFSNTLFRKLSAKIRAACSEGPASKCIWISKCVVFIAFCVFVMGYIAYSCYNAPQNLVSLVGLAFLLIFSAIISRNPEKINPRVILVGLGLQFALGLFITRVSFGRVIFETLGEGAKLMGRFSDEGSRFMFSGVLVPSGPGAFIFAFRALPIIVVYSSLASILYHFGVMQWVISAVAWFMQHTIGTSAPETFNAAANIFLGQTEAPLLIRPLLPTLTKSELHAVMTGGFATIAGAVLAVYAGMPGIDASNLIAASVMNAPAALVFSKLVCPEVEVDDEKKEKEIDHSANKSECRNVFEAAAKGASDSIMFVANVAANLVAFISLVAMINFILGWLGGNVGFPNFTLQVINSYLFYPLVIAMGVAPEDAFRVAELIGTKTVVNEFVAYSELSDLVAAGLISDRSAFIATYALCGFANFSSLGIQIGGIGSLIPNRINELSTLGLTALLCGTFACFSNACIMGLLYQEPAGLSAIPGLVNNTAAALAS
jgi:pyrimidine nucleoside transport protein